MKNIFLIVLIILAFSCNEENQDEENQDEEITLDEDESLRTLLQGCWAELDEGRVTDILPKFSYTSYEFFYESVEWIKTTIYQNKSPGGFYHDAYRKSVAKGSCLVKYANNDCVWYFNPDSLNYECPLFDGLVKNNILWIDTQHPFNFKRMEYEKINDVWQLVDQWVPDSTIFSRRTSIFYVDQSFSNSTLIFCSKLNPGSLEYLTNMGFLVRRADSCQ